MFVIVDGRQQQTMKQDAAYCFNCIKKGIATRLQKNFFFLLKCERLRDSDTIKHTGGAIFAEVQRSMCFGLLAIV